ncbi:lea1 [Cystoisospora suis]|uniref:Lea1 n=1 Tax=Cystoisospora suis TaxID=483139 RepID=A0A2C6KZB0_9APIC|nr:lea1 [Cystoisospora suis]
MRLASHTSKPGPSLTVDSGVHGQPRTPGYTGKFLAGVLSVVCCIEISLFVFPIFSEHTASVTSFFGTVPIHSLTCKMQAFQRYFCAASKGGLLDRARSAAMGAKMTARQQVVALTEDAAKFAKQMKTPVQAITDTAKGLHDTVSEAAQTVADRGKQAVGAATDKAKQALPDAAGAMKEAASTAGQRMKDQVVGMGQQVKDQVAGAGQAVRETVTGSLPRGLSQGSQESVKATGEEAVQYGRGVAGQTSKEAGEDAARVARTQGVDAAVAMGKRGGR